LQHQLDYIRAAAVDVFVAKATSNIAKSNHSSIAFPRSNTSVCWYISLLLVKALLLLCEETYYVRVVLTPKEEKGLVKSLNAQNGQPRMLE
jgi:hypothetical protein